MDNYLRDCWYQGAWESELESGSLTRTLLGSPVLIFKTGQGYGAVVDRCPHRFAPLSAGKVSDGIVTCGYHGLAFDATGRCVGNPHGKITSAMQARAFPAVARHTAIWLWMGEPDRADEGLIPDLSFIDHTPPVARIALHMPTAADYRLIADNIMDLSHADYLHPNSLGGMMMHTQARTFDRGPHLVAEWTSPSCPAPPVFQNKVPSPAMCNYWIEVAWQAPATMVLSTAVVPAGDQRSATDEIVALHNIVPETERSSHYFMCATRGDHLDDAEFTRTMKAALETAFLEEDKPMIEQQQHRIGDADFWSLKPILLGIDAAAVKARRRLDSRIEAEKRTR